MDKDNVESNKIKAVVTALISRMTVLEQNYITIANQQTKFTTLSNRVEILEKQLYDCNSDLTSMNDDVNQVKSQAGKKEKEKVPTKRKESSSSWVDDEPRKKRNNKRESSVASSTSESSDNQGHLAEDARANTNRDVVPDFTLTHQCSHCKHQAPSKRALEDHIKKNHADVETLYCAKCSYNSVVKQELIDHFRSVHKKPAEEPRKNTSEDSNENANQIQPYGENSYNHHQCSQCGHRANSKRELEDHIKKNHADVETLYCAKCSYNSVVKQELIDHFRSIHRKPKD